MKLPSKERSRRYDSASRLAEDVQRHLTNEPVEARPPFHLVSAEVILHRNRVFASSVVAIFLALTIGLSVCACGVWR